MSPLANGSQVPSQINITHSIISGGTFDQHNHIYTVRSGERAGYTRLVENVAPTALHDSGHVVDPPKCHPNTRVAIIQTVIDWALGTTVDDDEINGKLIMWLRGSAGAGKSAIARSVAERCSKEGLLLGTFFFGAADPTRNHVGRLVATLAYQMCIVLPGFRDIVTALIEEDPLIFSRALSAQYNTLVIRPLSIIFSNHSGSTHVPCLIIIDGLDECSANIDSQRALLFTLQEDTTPTTPIRFLVCSRPESQLNSAFGLPRMMNVVHKIFLDDDLCAESDIRLYLEDKFKEIKEGHLFKKALPATWPNPATIDILVDKSSGQFIYAATVVRYVESPRHKPHQRLDAVFNLRPAFRDLPFTELDALYRHIISKADDLPTALDILAFPALYGDFWHILDVERLLRLEQGDVEVVLADLHSVVKFDTRIYRNQTSWAIGFLHKSMRDFLSDPQRAQDLYQDLFASRLLHISRSISFSSTHQLEELEPLSWICMPIDLVGDQLRDLADALKAGLGPSDILQVAHQFPIFAFTQSVPIYDDKTLHPPSRSCEFLRSYLCCLNSVKDVCESARLVNLDQIRQYCKGVLSVLENRFPNDWKAHFMYAYYHLLPVLHQGLHKRGRFNDYMDMGGFGSNIVHMLLREGSPYFDEVPAISYDLTKGVKLERSLAMSASFCLSFLCDGERSNARDERRISRIMGVYPRKIRDHPWRWRRMIPRRRSLHDQPVVMWTTHAFRGTLAKLRRIRRPLDETYIPSGNILTIRQYFHIKYHTRMQKPRAMEKRWPLYLIFMELLPCILPFAGWYEPLVTMCSKKCLAYVSLMWPKESRHARQAIHNYLQRMDSHKV
ncbi:hypothetical protein D9613_009764 [Agrocybe pediades]|uniref:Nephrocystin 3-like N-terminal domain-containing protein n=1 Tax=Agrocybe pediades TaxID=84607 RepID=A0A8H4VSL1_9AGAR|nr:hypothetical protein D9613_009764 [Agrocybe pediades]